MNLDDGLVGVVFVVCSARVVIVGGVKRPPNVFAIRAFADNDENVVHLIPAVVGQCLALLDTGGDEAIRVGGVQWDHGRDLRHLAAVRFRHKVLLPGVVRWLRRR